MKRITGYNYEVKMQNIYNIYLVLNANCDISLRDLKNKNALNFRRIWNLDFSFNIELSCK